MRIEDFKRLVKPLANKIFLLLGRAILKAVKNDQGTQKIQVVALDGETITNMERFQEYGFETFPKTDSEVAALFLNGNRDQGIAICVHDRRYRPKDLVEGETCFYTDEDIQSNVAGFFRVMFKRDRIYFRRSDKVDIDIDTDKTEDIGNTYIQNITTSKTVTVPSETNINTTEHKINSPQITLGSDDWAAVRKLIDERFKDLFNNHVHDKVQSGGSSTGTPTTLLTDSHMTDYTRAI